LLLNNNAGTDPYVEIANSAGVDGTGNVTNIIDSSLLTGGGSNETIFANSNVSFDYLTYNGADATGKLLSEDTTYASGAITYINYSYNGSGVQTGYQEEFFSADSGLLGYADYNPDAAIVAGSGVDVYGSSGTVDAANVSDEYTPPGTYASNTYVEPDAYIPPGNDTAGGGNNDAFMRGGGRFGGNTGGGGDTGGITLADGTSTTLTSSGNAVTIGNNDALTLSSSATLNLLNASGSGSVITDNGSGNSIVFSASSGTLDVGGTDTTAGATFSGANDLLELSGSSSGTIIFAGAADTLKLDFAEGFSGTVAGMASDDLIDLGDFLYSNNPGISSVTGSGAAGTVTRVTVTDGTQSATLALLNQYANQFAVNSSAYTLTTDTAHNNAGTFLQLAAGH
jgi:hypothetical protein